MTPSLNLGICEEKLTFLSFQESGFYTIYKNSCNLGRARVYPDRDRGNHVLDCPYKRRINLAIVAKFFKISIMLGLTTNLLYVGWVEERNPTKI
jgi:hypothetical protein